MPKPCEVDDDVNHYPLIVIDAKGGNHEWGSVTLNGAHGQGMLVVINGDLRIQGNFQFKGIVLVEGGIDVAGSGGGGNNPKFEGAVIALGMGPGGVESYVGDNTITGSPIISYNSCALAALNEVWAENDIWIRVVRPTFAWTELVR